VKLTEEMLEVLAGANPDGNLLYLQGSLDRKLYEQVDAALATVGGRWSKAKKAHVFPGPAYAAVVELSGRDEVETAPERRQRTQLFETPPDVVADLLDSAVLAASHVVLEPSAGRGAIASALAGLVAAVDCIEVDGEYAEAIGAAGYARKLTVADFLAVRPEPAYDRVVMNPPFTRGQDVTHVRHALRFVRPGGRLVAVMPASIKSRADQGARALRAVVAEAFGSFEDNDAGSFEASGTGVSTVIVTIPVPAPALTAPGVIRVTTDRTAGRLPMFDPAASAPGVYVHDSWTRADHVFRFRGDCIGCGRRTWAHDDGHDDVRGVFGDYTHCPLTDEDFDGVEGLDVPEDLSIPRCAACWNEREAYERATRKAVAMLRRGGRARTPAVALAPVAAGKPAAAAQLDLFSDGEDTAA
jgi:predicted RNA methylase